MSNDPLPRQVDVRKLAVRGETLCARESLTSFPRVTAQLLDEQGMVDIALEFATDEQRRLLVRGRVQAQLQVPCQRCLRAMLQSVDSEFAVGVVASDEEAQQLPRELEPYLVGEAPHDLAQLVEDELLLCLPFASYHPESECSGRSQYVSGAPEAPAQKDNPFQALGQLKPGKSEH